MDLRKYFRQFEQVTPVDHTHSSDSELNMFDMDNPDIGFFNLIDEELISIAGSELIVYKYERDNSHDDLYEEDMIKKYSEKVYVKGHYDPQPIQEELSEFGAKLTNDQIFIFNKPYIESKIGRTLIPGDVIQPKFQNLMYQVHEVQENSFAAYGVYHLDCAATLRRDLESLINENLTVRP